MAANPKTMKIRKVKGHIQFAFRIIISVGLMTWLISGIQWDNALKLMKEGSLLYFLFAFIAIQLTVIPSIWKWRMLISTSSTNHPNKSHVTFMKLTRYYYIGLFFNNFLPGSVGGDVMRVVYLGKDVGMPKATTSVAFERLTSGAALTGIVVFATVFMESVRPYSIPIYCVAGGLILVLILLSVWMNWLTNRTQEKAGSNTTETVQIHFFITWMNKIKQALVKLAETAVEYRTKGKVWWGTIALLSFLFQIGLAWINQLLFLGFGIEINMIDLIVFISLISFITMLPISLNGIGVRDASYIFFFKELGVPDELAISVSLLFLILVTISSLCGGLFWLIERRKPVEAIGQQTY